MRERGAGRKNERQAWWEERVREKEHRDKERG